MATRKQIRDAVKTLLTPIFAAVYTTGANNIESSEYPAAVVSINHGETEDINADESETRAILQVEITGTNTVNVADYLDILGNQTSNALLNSNYLDGTLHDLTRAGFELEEDNSNFEGMLTLNFNIYYTDED